MGSAARCHSPSAVSSSERLPGEEILADATDRSNHIAALHMVTMQGGVFGCVSTSDAVIAATSGADA